MPVLLETGTFELNIKNGHAANLRCYALDFSGERFAELLADRKERLELIGTRLVDAIEGAVLSKRAALVLNAEKCNMRTTQNSFFALYCDKLEECTKTG